MRVRIYHVIWLSTMLNECAGYGMNAKLFIFCDTSKPVMRVYVVAQGVGNAMLQKRAHIIVCPDFYGFNVTTLLRCKTRTICACGA